ncbi:MAG: hypothetical protein K8S99_01185 [Planctomycetes bacterium]|nr:hypothetical protein [Planctomycetota bacterium]
MRSHPLRILVIAWLAAWFIGIVPLHQRGAIALPGTAVSSADSCCAKPVKAVAAPSCHDEKTKESKQRGGDPVKRCAICYIVATLAFPVAIDLTVPEMRVLDEIDLLPPAQRIAAAEVWPVTLGRAPPSLA